jgi:hypothetical protein
MTDKELFGDYYTEDQMAKLLNLSVRSLRNRHAARKNHPPRTPEGLYPKKEFAAWNAERLQWETSDARKRKRA